MLGIKNRNVVFRIRLLFNIVKESRRIWFILVWRDIQKRKWVFIFDWWRGYGYQWDFWWILLVQSQICTISLDTAIRRVASFLSTRLKSSGLKRCQKEKSRNYNGFWTFLISVIFWKMKDAKRRFRPCARNRTGGTLFQGGFQRVFLLRKPPFFRFSQKTLLNFCVWERRCFGSPTYIKKKTATAATACIIPKENANCSGAVAIRTKYARGPPLPQTWK